MGHNRLGTLPDTAPWRRVVGAIADGDSAADVAAATTDAATSGLDRAKADPGLARAVYLLARTVLAAREPDFPAALAADGVFVPPDPGLFDLTAAVLTAVHDWYAASRTRRTDLGEMAALAATEALARCAGDPAGGLFPDGGEARRAARALSTKAGFGRLAHALFARFTARFLMYHLGRELPLHVGGNGRFADPAAHTAFVRDLDTHCDQAALIVKDFAAGWFDKSRVEGGVTAARTRGFAAHCVTKLSGELARRGGAVADPVLVLCGGAPPPRRPAKDQPTLRLTIGPGRDQVHLGVARLSAQLLARAPAVEADLLEEAPADPAAPEVEEVVLFSGGLDSLGGAVEELLAGQRLTALVSHRPANHVHARQRVLVAALRARLPHPGLAPLHVGLVANKGPALDREFTQRSRAFLFAAAAAVVARQLGRRRVRFYENGVTSLNLPVSPQLIGGQASRTTHPQTLARLGRLFSVLFDAPFAVENPFLWRTKAQILERLAGLGHADLCARTSSCAHPRTRTRRHPHCGLCSQCVDRRVSALAARLPDAADPPGGYGRDVLTGERDGAALTFVERYVGTALDLEGVPPAVRFAARYAEVNQAIPYVGLPAGAAAAALFDLHRRHAEGVRGVVARALADRTGDLIRQAFPARSLLGVVIGRAARRPAEVVAPAVVAPGRPAAGGRFVLDETRFEARCGGKACGFGNTNEYWVVKELAKDAGGCVSVAALQAAVWRDAVVEKNTIQKTVGNARRKLRRLPGVSIASLKDHYRLVLPPG